MFGPGPTGPYGSYAYDTWPSVANLYLAISGPVTTWPSVANLYLAINRPVNTWPSMANLYLDINRPVTIWLTVTLSPPSPQWPVSF